MLVHKKRKAAVTLEGRAQIYSHPLQLYTQPPTSDISLEDFENWAIDRLHVLKSVEASKVRFPTRNAESRKMIDVEVKKYLPLTDAHNNNSDQCELERRKDHISHFILRLAFCRTEELRRFFLSCETDLFRHRFEKLAPQDVTAFLNKNQLHYKPISANDKQEVYDQLVASVGYVKGEDGTPTEFVRKEDFFMVPFEEALELVKHRKVFVKAGKAYIPRSELVAILVGVFRTRLSQALVTASRALPQLEEDERLLPLLTNLSQQDLSQDYTNKKLIMGQISASEVKDLVVPSFAPCMRNLYNHLHRDNHLRHAGRMQYGLFLKGIGLSLDEALIYWRSAFQPKVTSDVFDKQYAYNIRHNYGKEGKRTDYTPYSCLRIIKDNGPGAGEHHGCPFKHFDERNLRSLMFEYGVGKAVIENIVELVKGSRFDVACTKYFEAVHKVENVNFIIDHPNTFFVESRKLTGGIVDVKKEGASQVATKSSGSVGMSSSNQQTNSTPPESKSGEAKAPEDEDFDEAGFEAAMSAVDAFCH